MSNPSSRHFTERWLLEAAVLRDDTGKWYGYVHATADGQPEHEWTSGASEDDFDQLVALAADYHNEWKAWGGLVEARLYEAIPHPMLF